MTTKKATNEKFIGVFSIYIISSIFLYFFVKIGVENSAPSILMSIRYAVAGSILYLLSKKIIINKSVIFLSLFTSISTLFWAYGLIYVNPASSSVISYTMPFFALVLAFFFLRENPTFFEIIGLIIGFAGLGIYSLPLLRGLTALGVLLTIIDAFFWAVFSVYYRKLSNYDVLSLNASQFMLGALCMAVYTLFLPRSSLYISFNMELVESLVYISTIGGALQFLAWNYMLKLEKVNRVTALAYVVPIGTTLVQIPIYKKLPSLIQIIGLIVIIVGVVLSRYRKVGATIP